MSTEPEPKVVIELPKGDYFFLLWALGYATGRAFVQRDLERAKKVNGLYNRIERSAKRHAK